MSDENNSSKSEKNVSRRKFLGSVVDPARAAIAGVPENTPQKKKILGKHNSKGFSRRSFIKVAAGGAAVVGLALALPKPMFANASDSNQPSLNYKGKVSAADRLAAANSRGKPAIRATVIPAPGGTPDYFGFAPNYANSLLPKGAITSIMVTNGGSGYTAPTVAVTDAYGTGAGATAAATVVGGVITGVTITAAGTNYSAPQITITDAVGTGAAASAAIGGTLTGGIHKFIDAVAGLNSAGASTTLGTYIPIAIPDTTTYPGCDYYEIQLGEFTQKFHTNLPATKLRGYRQTNTTDVTVSKFSYLGPLIIAQRNRPVRVKFTNSLPTGTNGNLFIPVDTTYMGAGTGPNGGTEMYKQNRATLHLHGGTTPWISDGTPHQWTTPAGETTSYPKGVSVYNVPDMDGGVEPQGTLTFYYTNQQSARLMFYHDHAYGITRLNVYVGEAAGYLVTDPVESTLINGGTIPGTTTVVPAGTIPSSRIPLIIQDKTFVDATTILAQDPTWNWGSTPGTPVSGDLWWPHVYMPNQNPYVLSGANPMGRWDYGPWFWPPFTGITVGPALNPYYDPVNAPWEPPVIPGTPNPSGVPESFLDTPLVNGVAYPYIIVQPQAYRLNILNACNDRMLNLQLYQATGIVNTIAITFKGSGYTAAPAVTITGGGGSGATATATVAGGLVTSITIVTVGSGFTSAPTVTISPPASGTTAIATATIYTGLTEVGMLPAVAGAWPTGWPTPDGRAGGFPDPATAGPNMIQIGTEGGILAAPAVVPNRPVGYDYNRRSVTVLNVLEKALFLGPAERADVIVDFSAFAGKTLILYNDAPAPVPGFDPRLDYFTGDGDQTSTGGAPNTMPNYGPNTRTIMQIRVANATPTPFNVTPLNTALPIAFAASQDTIIAPQAPYNAAYNSIFPGDVTAYTRIQDTTHTFTPIAVFGSALKSLLVVTGGTGYTSSPTVTITGGGGTGATANATVTAGAVTAFTITNAGSGYTYPPIVGLTGGGGTGATAASTIGGTAALTMALQPKAIQELFTTDYGRMNALLGVEVPNTTGINQTTIIQGYIDPPTELVRYSDKLTPIGSANDGTQIWKVTHNGVDTHAIHFHMYNVQIINRVGWDGAIRGPDPNEIGWKDTVRMHPLEDAIIALRPIAIQNLPFKIPNSIRALDVTMPLGTTTQFEGVNPLGNPVTVTNTLLNFGCEYVWHCHLLGHEENDMMRAQALAVPPEAPTNLVATLEPSNAVLLTWTDNSINATGFTVQRATDSSFITGLATFNLGKVSSFLDNTLTSNLLPFYYRVFANNIVGSTVVGTTVTGLPAATGYPTLTVNSLTNRVTNIANLVVRGTNNILYYRTYNSSTNTWNNWTALPAGSTMDEPAATVAGGAIHVVVRGMDGNSLYYGNINQATSTFSGWTPLSPMAGGSTPSAPTLTSNDTSLILVVRGPNNLVNYRFYDLATQAWTDWIALPSQTTSGGPAAAILGKMLHIVVKDLAGISLFYGSVDLGTNLFSGWMPITGFTPSDPTLTSNGTTLALVVRGGDNAVYYRFYNPVTQTWTSWSSLPTGTTIEGPAGATILGNKLHIVVRGNDGNSLWHSNLDISSTVFSGWTYLTGSTPSKPTLAS